MAALSPGSHLGRYEIKEPLGRGGMAIVFKGYDPVLGREVAVKVLSAFLPGDPTFPERFAQEARTIARLNHPNILQIFDYGEDQGFIFIVSELLVGGTLQESLHRPLALEDAFKILRPLSEALDHAHANGVIHRDIKPSNVLMDADSIPKLADFGLSRVMEHVYRMTNPNDAIGTPEYMSPEQAMGRNTDYRSDLYSFGILMYQILVGRTPFHADTAAATLMAHVNQELSFPLTGRNTLSDAVKAVLTRATAKNPDERFRSATEIVDALAAAAFQSTPISTQARDTESPFTPTVVVDASAGGDAAAADASVSPSITPSRIPSRKWMFAGASIAMLALIVVVAAVFAFPDDDANAPASEPTAISAATSPFTQESTPQAVSTSTPAPTQSATSVSSQISVSGVIATATAVASYTQGIQANVSLLRGLHPEQEISNIEFKPKEGNEDFVDTYFRRADLRNMVFEFEELYTALGLIDGDDDLEQIIRDVFVRQVAANFDDESGRFYILSDSPTIGPSEELAYATVYMGELQQQLFDVTELRRKARSNNFDAFRAVTAFTSGEVVQIMRGYRQKYFDQEQRVEIRQPLQENLFSGAPNVIKSMALFPEYDGGDFVAAIHAAGEWDAVNAVYDSPPASTEQIIHPEKYIAGEAPIQVELPDIRSELGIGWSDLSTNRMGEFLIRTYLEEHLDIDTASSAAYGWGGDEYTLLLGPAGESVFVLKIEWDTQEDAAEFFAAYRRFAFNMTQETLVSRRGDESREWWIAQEKTAFVRNEGTRTLLILADTEALVNRVLSFLPVS